MQRVARVKTWEGIMSSYQRDGGVGGPRETLRPLAELGDAAFVVPDMHEALVGLNDAVLKAGGDLRITDAFRSTDVQQRARAKYERWVEADKPSRQSVSWESGRMKDAYVARPGYSFHNGGRAIDIHVDELKFPNLSWDRQLDKMWDLAVPLGWAPIIERPIEGQKESWHFDFRGPWQPVYHRLGYKAAAMCATMDIGATHYERFAWKYVQAQLHRAGYDVGQIDGLCGKKTSRGLVAIGSVTPPPGTVPTEYLMMHVSQLNGSERVRWMA